MNKTTKSMVTVIVPTYNLETHVLDTLKSISSQSLADFEVIIVDDGSSDRTHDIALDFSLRDHRFSVLRKRNGGVSSARNVALGLVKSHYYTFVDGDDVISPSYLERLVNVAEQSGAAVVSSRIVATKPDVEGAFTENISTSEAVSLKGEQAVVRFLYNKNVQNSACAKLFRTTSLSDIRFDESLSVGEDMEYVFRAIKSTGSLSLLNDVMYFYIQRQGSAMNSAFSPKRLDGYRAAEKINMRKDLTEYERIAARVKMFTEAFSILVVMVSRGSDDRDVLRVCRNAIKRTNLMVAFGKGVRMRQRIYALVSIVSINLAIKLAMLKKYSKLNGAV